MLMWRGGQVARWESSRVADDTQSLFLLERNPLCYSTLYYIHNHGWGGGDIESLSSQEKYIVPLLEIDRLHSVSQNMCTVHRTMQCINVSHFPHMSEIIKCKLKQMQTLENNMHSLLLLNSRPFSCALREALENPNEVFWPLRCVCGGWGVLRGGGGYPPKVNVRIVTKFLLFHRSLKILPQILNRPGEIGIFFFNIDFR